MKSLQDKVSNLSGIGPKKELALKALGIETIEDLLCYYPFRYEDMATKEVSELADGQKAVIQGVVATAPVVVRFGRAKNRLNFKLLAGHDVIQITFFGQAYLKDRVQPGSDVAVYGKYDTARQSMTGMKLFSNGGSQEDIAGIYRASKEIKAQTIKQLVKKAYEEYQDVIEEIVPESTRRKFRLLNRKEMIHDMHFPKTTQEFEIARRSAIFDEFFKYEARLALLKKLDRNDAGLLIKYDNSMLKRFISALPFELTNAQKRVVNEICKDMHRPLHMNRLLQGDVGSGKTVIAAIAMYAAVTAGFQAALMAPTEILAQQHAKKLSDLFQDFGVSVCLLTGTEASKTKVKHDILKRLANKEIDILVGTHALIQDPVIFKKLGLVVTDEQHRFGVNQRKALREKGENPDVLAMTATPIPRTLAITTYGEMDVSVINELPKGRKPIRTSWVKQNQMNATLDFVERQLKDGSQAYVVSPLIEESEAVDLKNAQEVFEKLEKRYAPCYKVGLLHGRMKSDEKDEIMKDFKEGKYDILVSTTVVEVGVDVPNATVMVILDADRFGLAQLHQLRGRVGRGSKASYCILCADPKTDYGKERMQTMVETTDGFVISQKELELRGPGEVLGSRQSGLPDFRIGDPVANFNTLQAAMEEARAIILDENFEYRAENAGLIRYLRAVVLAGANFD